MVPFHSLILQMLLTGLAFVAVLVALSIFFPDNKDVGDDRDWLG